MACPPRKKLKGASPLYDRKRTVFVGNLPFDVKVIYLFCLSTKHSSFIFVSALSDSPLYCDDRMKNYIDYFRVLANQILGLKLSE